MIGTDNPARIWSPGTFSLSEDATYTIGKYEVVQALKDLLEHSDGELACDIETFGLGLLSRYIKSVTFSDEHHAVICDPRDPGQEALIKDTFRQASAITFHNTPYDVPNLYINGLIRLEDISKITDTLIYARLADPGLLIPKNLEDASARYLSVPALRSLAKAAKALGISKTKMYYEFDLDRPIYIQGAAYDPLLTQRLLPVVRRAAYAKLTTNHPFHRKAVMGEEAWRLVEREQIINRVLLARSCKGYLVDFDYLEEYTAKHGADIHVTERELEELGIRPGVAQDLIKHLDKLNAIPADHPKTGTGLWSGQAKHLKLLSNPVASKFVAHKEALKVKKDYLEKAVELADPNGRIHPVTNLFGADTGRMSMGEPPIHQFPPPARRIIRFDDSDSGTSLDWSQIEPILIANAARDTAVIDAYESKSGGDVYTALGKFTGMLPENVTTEMCEYNVNPKYYLVRKWMKVVLLAQLYGEGLKKLSADLKLDPGPYSPATDWEIEVRKIAPGTMMPRYAEAARLKEAVFKAMPKTAALIKQLKDIAKAHKKIITISGRVLDIPSSSRHGTWMVEAHKGINYFNQGSAYDILAETLIRGIEQGLGDSIYFTMHDELIVSTSAAHDWQKIMQTPPDRLCFWAGRTPILRTDRFDMGKNWLAA